MAIEVREISRITEEPQIVQIEPVRQEVPDLKAEIVMASNAIHDAKKVNSVDLQLKGMERLTDLLAQNGSALEVLRSLQPKK